jgi:hypothetical protein
MCTPERSFLGGAARALLLTMLLGASLSSSSQTSIHATNAKTWILSNADEFQVAAPPSLSQANRNWRR